MGWPIYTVYPHNANTILRALVKVMWGHSLRPAMPGVPLDIARGLSFHARERDIEGKQDP